MIPSVFALASQFMRERAEHDRREMEIGAARDRAMLRLLQLELQPHFLLDALPAVSELLDTDAGAARAMIASLGDLMRVSLERMHVLEVPLRDELALLGFYLDFQRARFRDRLVVRTDVPTNTMDAHVPTLLLQPLVDLAIRHTVERTDRTGTVHVSTARQGDELHVGVRDDGPGSSRLDRQCGGRGLASTRQRLEQLHGARQRLELLDSNGNGELVRVVLPFRTVAAA